MADDAKPPVSDHFSADDPSPPDEVRAMIREADEASDWVDAWLERNAEALNLLCAEAEASLARGEGRVGSALDLLPGLRAEARRRAAGGS